MTILLEYTPKYFSRLSPHLRFQFLFSQLWYLGYSTIMLLMFGLPLIALLFDRPLANVAYPHFLFCSLPLAILLMVIVGRLRAFGLLRPSAAKIFSWEGVFFLFARWPWTLMGSLAALRARITGTVSEFRVTPKGEDSAAELPVRVVAPYALLSIVSGLAVLFIDSETAPGYYIFALLNCCIYTLLLLIILRQHTLENIVSPTGASRKLLLSCSRAVLIGAAVLIPLLGTTRVPAGVSGLLWTAPSSEITGSVATLPQAGQLVFGIYDPADAIGENESIGIDHIFIHWNVFNRKILSDASRRASSRNRILMVTVEPFTYALNWSDGGEKLFSEISRGTYDDSIEDVCGSLGKIGAPVLVRWGHEMDDQSGRYPWARNDPSGFIHAFRHFVQECRVRAPEAKYVWSPKGKRHVEQFYPGDDFVDFVGFSAFSLETWDLEHLGRASLPEEMLGKRYSWLSLFNKPVIVAELGVSGGGEYVERWLQQTNQHVRHLPLLSAIIYFNDKEPYTWGDTYGSPDWRVNREMLQALTQGLKDQK